MCVEADLVVADQFCDGNVPVRQDPLSCCRMAIKVMPPIVADRYFRGDSARYETELL